MNAPALAGITEKMQVRKEGGIGWITFNNPARLNAVSMSMWEAIPVILDAFEKDPEVRVVVMRGAGEKAFVSGADISEFGEKRNDPETSALYNAASDQAGAAIKNFPKPLIAMIKGYCIGGGVAIAIGADLRIAADDTVYSVPAAKLGLGYRYDGIKHLMDLVGPSYTAEIFFTARKFNAEEALRMGLVNTVVPAADLEAKVTEYASTIAGNAPMTVAAAKRCIVEARKASTADRNIKLCQQMVDACFASADYTEGRTAFMEKRKPAFKGR